MAGACWTRKTPWRQGAVLPPEAAVSLGLVAPEQAGQAVVVVISHDCDLVIDNLEVEPYVEVIVGGRMDKLDGNFTAAKSTRKLHLEIGEAEPHVMVELVAIRKAVLPKEKLADFEPDPSLAVTGKNLPALQAWLADRYRRSAFPDELVKRLEPVESVFSKAVKKSTSEILGLFIDYDPEEDGLSEDEPYQIVLLVVYDGDTAEAEAKALAVADTLTAAFKQHYLDNGKWRLLELQQCTALSDTEFTLRDVLQTKRYRLEYLSYRQDPPGQTAETM